MQKQFEHIFKTKRWMSSQGESVSGSGSTLEYTEPLRKDLIQLIQKYNIKTFLDAPCGDFNWMKEVVPHTNIEYIGADIVEPLVQQNNEKYKSDNISFMHLDITKDSLPDADIMMCRDCLFHLDYDSIQKFFTNFKKSNIQYLFTTTHINNGFLNRNINIGGFRPIDLFLDPFNINPNEVLETVKDYVGVHLPRNMILLNRDSING